MENVKSVSVSMRVFEWAGGLGLWLWVKKVNNKLWINMEDKSPKKRLLDKYKWQTESCVDISARFRKETINLTKQTKTNA